MKKSFMYTIVIVVGLYGCNKTNEWVRPASTPLDGTWRMILVTDIATGSTETKPASIPGDVDITFTSVNAAGGTFAGLTPTNQIWQNDYITGSGGTLTIPEIGMTKVWETSWGSLFVVNARHSLSYTISTSNILNITTAEKILIFQKLP